LNLNNQNHYTYIDNKTVPIVFIHGVGLDSNMWSPQINYFKNHSILTYDLLGHGKTPYKKESIEMIENINNGIFPIKSSDPKIEEYYQKSIKKGNFFANRSISTQIFNINMFVLN